MAVDQGGQVGTRMTHESLRKRAVSWLTNTMHCGVVLSELRAYTEGNEIPDAIGWKADTSTLIEIKVSRSDFHANKDKYCARSGIMMGAYRYFLTPANLVGAEEIDDEHGLLWAFDRQIKIVKKAQHRIERSWTGEMAMLVSALRRVRTREFLTIVRSEEERQ